MILENACVVPDPIDLSSLEMSCNQAKETFVLRIQKIEVIVFDYNKQKNSFDPKDAKRAMTRGCSREV